MADRLEDGSECPNCREGRLDMSAGENCSCHLSAPCHSCLTTGLLCNVCGWRLGDELDDEPQPVEVARPVDP